MTEGLDKKLGWGKPVSLDGRTADDIRYLLEEEAVGPTGTESYNRYMRLKRLFLASPDECSTTRGIIRTCVYSFWNTDTWLDVDDEGYDDQQRQLSEALLDARAAFDERPDGCEMQIESDDHYTCNRCGFEASMDLE